MRYYSYFLSLVLFLLFISAAASENPQPLTSLSGSSAYISNQPTTGLILFPDTLSSRQKNLLKSSQDSIHLSNLLDEQTQSLQDLEQQWAKLEAGLASLSSVNSVLTDSLKNLLTKTKSLKEDLSSLRTQIAESKKEMTKLENNIARADKLVADLQSKLNACIDQNKSLNEGRLFWRTTTIISGAINIIGILIAIIIGSR